METYLRIRNNLFLIWGGDAPNPFRDIPFYSMSLHSAGLPGRVKNILASFAREDIFYLTAAGNLVRIWVTHGETQVRTYYFTNSIPAFIAFSFSGRYFQLRSDTECLMPSIT